MKRKMAAVCAASLAVLLCVLIFAAVQEYRKLGVEADWEYETFDLQKESTKQEQITGETEHLTQEMPTEQGILSETESLPSAVISYDKETELLFAGDICIQDYIAEYYDKDGIQGIVSEKLEELMEAADVMMANQEFVFSERGEPMEEKEFVFRIAPRYTAIFSELGLDIVTLANNHALDYGQEALLDSFDALDAAGIRYVGAGKNLERAKKLEIIEKNGQKIGFLAASRVIPVHDWNAGKNSPGMLTTYDPAALIAEIEKGKEYCDILIVYVHWGEERKELPEDYQRTMAYQYIDAGADAVIGSHPHVMQGIEYYKDKPIAYSLGNYIFTPRTGISALLRLTFKQEGACHAELVPVDASAFPVAILEEERRGEFFRYMESISFGISIDEDGRICYTQDN